MRVEFSFWGASNGLGEVFEQASRGTKHLKGFRFGVGSGLSGLIDFFVHLSLVWQFYFRHFRLESRVFRGIKTQDGYALGMESNALQSDSQYGKSY